MRLGDVSHGRPPVRPGSTARAVQLELVVQPFRYREAAQFWGITDPRLAVLVHAVTGGTPAYRYEFTRGDVPASTEILMPG